VKLVVAGFAEPNPLAVAPNVEPEETGAPNAGVLLGCPNGLVDAAFVEAKLNDGFA
jgi:hypothetical protein